MSGLSGPWDRCNRSPRLDRQSLAEPRLGISLRMPERIRPGVDHEGDGLGISERSEGFQFLDLLLEGHEFLRRMIEIFDVDSNGPRAKEALHHRYDLPRCRSKSTDDVRTERNRKSSGDPLGCRHVFLRVDDLSIRVAKRHHDSRTRRGDGRETFIFEDASTGDIPCVRQDEQLLASMEVSEFLRLFNLVRHPHRPLRSGSDAADSTRLPDTHPKPFPPQVSWLRLLGTRDASIDQIGSGNDLEHELAASVTQETAFTPRITSSKRAEE